MSVRPFALALALALSFVPALRAASETHEAGHWDDLGEDGRVWVPDAPPIEAAYLPAPPLGDYHNASEAVAALQALALARPDLVSVRTLGASVQGRSIVLATLTAPGDASARTRVLFDGAHHGDEVIASEILVRFLQRAIAEYDTNATLRAYLQQAVVEVVPMVNPDGIDRVPTCSYYADCRKNARGVDLNRNYPAHWGEPGSSGNRGDATYRGPSPASEPETRVVRDLLDQTNYALYASLHSGAEMILWPWGWTTTSPPEVSVYNTLGAELSALTGAPHGQVSRILYGVSGDSMDQAYGAAANWRAIAISPETYEGSGGAYDWWFLFNPPETHAEIAPHVARWEKFLWRVVAQAPNYAPAKLTAPPSLSLGPDAGDLNVVVTGAPRRPFQGASLAFGAGDAVSVLGPNPRPLADASGAQNVTMSLLPLRGGDFTGTLTLRAGPAGNLSRAIALQLVQVGLTLALDTDTMGSPDANVAHVTLDAGPFVSAVGNVTIVAQPQGIALGMANLSATQGSPASADIPFTAHALRAGSNAIQAVASFIATDAGGEERPGQLIASAPLTVLRPQIELEKRFAPTTIAGQGLPITAIYRNTGSSLAEDLVVRETIPIGYAYHTRDGPVPIPPDPLGRPQPTAIEPQPDGTLVIVWSFGDVAPGQFKVAQYRLLAIAPGPHTLPSAWSYAGEFASGRVEYAGAAAPGHTVRAP